MTKLSVNINKIALIRNSRKGNNPSLEFFSKKIIESGAHGITVHPRPDLRHIRPDDLSDISLITKELDVEFNIEGNPYEERLGDYPGFLNLIDAVKPSQCTLVPDDSNQLTSDHGWNIHSEQNKLKDVLTYLKQNNIRSSVFIDPDISQLDAAKDINPTTFFSLIPYHRWFVKTFTDVFRPLNHDSKAKNTKKPTQSLKDQTELNKKRKP